MGLCRLLPELHGGHGGSHDAPSVVTVVGVQVFQRFKLISRFGAAQPGGKTKRGEGRLGAVIGKFL